MKASTRLREAIHHTLQQCANDLEAQRIATEYAYRKRIHEFERAKGELEWQKKNVCLTLVTINFQNSEKIIFDWCKAKCQNDFMSVCISNRT